jgi:integrase
MRPINGHRKYVFASISKPTTTLSENTLNLGLQRMGFEATSHGMRATFSTITNESLNFRREVIEHALAHQERNKVVAAYNRSDYFEERKKLMQWWANYLDSCARIQANSQMTA